MKSANLEDLKEKIIRPGMDKHLVPLMLYRGSNNMQFFGRVQRCFNFAVTCMESEVENYSEAVKLGNNPDFAHLCGPRKPLQYGNFASVFGRMLDNPKVTDNVHGLTDYVKSIRGAKYKLTPVSLYTNDMRQRMTSTVAPWRVIGYSPEELERRAGIRKVRRQLSEGRKLEREIMRRKKAADILSGKDEKKLFYPYVIHKPRGNDSEYELMMDVNKAVPAHLPDWLRADICQDLICAILAGDIGRDQIKEGAKSFTKKLWAMHPTKYGPLSLDAPFSDDNDRTLLDVISGSPLETY